MIILQTNALSMTMEMFYRIFFSKTAKSQIVNIIENFNSR